VTDCSLRHRVLVVDDQPGAADAICTLLRLLGHDARGLSCGADVIATVETFHPTLVLLDVGLPDVNGYQLARDLRAREHSSFHLVAITGWGSPADRTRALEAGFDEHVVKPVDAKVIRRLLGHVPPAIGAHARP
jgi:DNA-binding response OmpR family regulator